MLRGVIDREQQEISSGWWDAQLMMITFSLSDGFKSGTVNHVLRSDRGKQVFSLTKHNTRWFDWWVPPLQLKVGSSIPPPPLWSLVGLETWPSLCHRSVKVYLYISSKIRSRCSLSLKNLNQAWKVNEINELEGQKKSMLAKFFNTQHKAHQRWGQRRVKSKETKSKCNETRTGAGNTHTHRYVGKHTDFKTQGKTRQQR